jgi:hypothetical protein
MLPVPPKWTHEHEDKHIAMKKPKVVSLAEENSLIRVGHGNLMDRVVSILEQARTNVARSVNSNMVIAYWLVGREVVVALQGGEERAEYGERLLGDLSEQLTKRYGRGFSVTNLRYFRLFYQVFSDRAPEIHHSSSDELGPLSAIARRNEGHGAASLRVLLVGAKRQGDLCLPKP